MPDQYLRKIQAHRQIHCVDADADDLSICIGIYSWVKLPLICICQAWGPFAMDAGEDGSAGLGANCNAD